MNRVLIVDVEATCEKDDDSFDNETIEIGGVVVDERYQELAIWLPSWSADRSFCSEGEKAQAEEKEKGAIAPFLGILNTCEILLPSLTAKPCGQHVRFSLALGSS